MPRKKKTEAESDAVPNSTDAPAVLEEQSEPVKYVVLRAGCRVSDTEYDNLNDPAAAAEKEYWEKVAKKSKDGSKVEIVQFNKRLHRIW